MKTELILTTLLGVLALSSSTHGAGLAPTIRHAAASKIASFDATTSSNPDFGTALIMFTNAFQRIMPCGYAPYDIPALAPLSVEYWPFHVNNDYLQVNGNVSNLIISGMNNYRNLKLDYNATNNRTTFDIDYSQMQILGEYMIDIWALLAGWPFSTPGAGMLNVKITDLRLVGGFTLVTNPTNPNGLAMTDVNINFYLADIDTHNWNSYWNIALNNFVNKANRDATLVFAEQIQPRVNAIFDAMLLPIVNHALQNVSMQELIGFFVLNANLWNAATCNAVA